MAELIIVTGGRGMKGREELGPPEGLSGTPGEDAARNLEGGCGRGWRPMEQVGPTGKPWLPSSTLHWGASGADPGAGGNADSETIVAVNKDPDVPILPGSRMMVSWVTLGAGAPFYRRGEEVEAGGLRSSQRTLAHLRWPTGPRGRSVPWWFSWLQPLGKPSKEAPVHFSPCLHTSK